MLGKLTRQAGLLTLSRSLGQILNVVVGMLIVRTLTQYDYGTYRQVILLYSTIYLMGDAAFAQSLYQFIPRHRERAAVFMGQAMLAALVMSALWTAALLGLAQPIAGYFGNPGLATHMALLAAYLSLNLLAKVPEAGLITQERAREFAINTVLYETLRFGFVLAALYWNASITWILAAMTAAAAIRLLLLLPLVRMVFRLAESFREQFQHAMALWLPGLMNNSAVYAHQYIVGYYFLPEEYAIYAVACFQVPFMGVMFSSLNEVFLVRATRLASHGERAEMLRLWHNACAKSLFIFIPVTVGLAVLARPLITFFYTERYLASVPLFAVILLALPFNGLFQDGVFRAFNRMRAYAFFYTLRIVLALGLGIAGVHFFGLWGAAVSSTLAIFLLNAAQLVKVAELLRAGFSHILPWGQILRILLASAVAAVPAWLVEQTIRQPLLALALGCAVFGAVYLGMMLALRLAAPRVAGGGRKVRVMLFTDSFIHGGTERQVVETLGHLTRERFDVSIGCLKRSGPFLAEVEAMGIPVMEFHYPGASLASRARRYVEITRHLQQERVDILHAFDFYTDLYAVPAARLAGVPVVIASRRNLMHHRGPLQRGALRVACWLADAVVANSRVAARTVVGLSDAPSDKVTVVHNAIDPAGYSPDVAADEARARLNLPAGALLVGVVAALRREKGHATFLRAAARVAAELPAARFVLIGDGPERARLEALAAELRIAERVVFAGDRSDVPQWLAALDISVLPSDFESLPNAVLEAMAAARPVVASQVGGVPELVEEGVTGYLVPVGDDAAMAARIVELGRDAELRARMGTAARARVEREFTPQRTVRKLEDLYLRLLRRKQHTARVLQIGNYPPPVCGWSIHTQLVDQELAARGADSRVMDIGPGRRVAGRGCIPVHGALDYAAKLIAYRLRGFTFQMHVNGDSWKGYTLALAAVLLGRLTGKPAVLTFHAGPSQLYFPRARGFWYRAFRLLFRSCGEIICNHEPVKKLIEAYGVPPEKVHAIPAYSTQYSEELPVPLPAAAEQFLAAHGPRLFSYSLFRPEFTMEVLFESFARIREKYPRAGLLLAGPKEVPSEAVEQMQRLGIADAVLIPGNLPHSEFLTAMQRSDVVVRTHLRDGVCTSVLEALQLGVPVVAAEDGLRPPSVITYSPPETAQLVAALQRVLADLPAARAQVRAPGVDNHLEREVALLLEAGASTALGPRRVAEGV